MQLVCLFQIFTLLRKLEWKLKPTEHRQTWTWPGYHTGGRGWRGRRWKTGSSWQRRWRRRSLPSSLTENRIQHYKQHVLQEWWANVMWLMSATQYQMIRTVVCDTGQGLLLRGNNNTYRGKQKVRQNGIRHLITCWVIGRDRRKLK